MRVRTGVLMLLVCLTLTGCGGFGARQTLLGEAAGVSEEATLLTVEGRAVPAWRYLCWLADACDGVDEQGWEDPAGTVADLVKEEALEDTALYAIASTVA